MKMIHFTTSPSALGRNFWTLHSLAIFFHSTQTEAVRTWSFTSDSWSSL